MPAVGEQSAPTLAQPAELGEVVDGKYRVDQVIATGGMGVVFRASDLAQHTMVALTVFLPDLAQTEEAGRALLGAARAAARLRSPHVARTLGAGRLASGAPYVATEYLVGCDLAALLRERVRLDTREIVGCMLQICDALGEAHAAGIIHRALKPENVFLTRDAVGDPVVKVLDVGISSSVAVSATQANGDRVTLIGSPLYMSPEQMTTPGSVDVRSDIWGLGVVAYEMATGRPAFEAESLSRICARVLKEDPRSLRALRRDIPDWLSDVIARCLAKDREQRYASIDEVASVIVDGLGPPVVRAERAAPVRGESSVSERVGLVAAPLRAETREQDQDIEGVDDEIVWWEERLRARRAGRLGRALALVGLFVMLGCGVALALLDPATRVDVLAWHPGRPFPSLRARPRVEAAAVPAPAPPPAPPLPTVEPESAAPASAVPPSMRAAPSTTGSESPARKTGAVKVAPRAPIKRAAPKRAQQVESKPIAAPPPVMPEATSPTTPPADDRSPSNGAREPASEPAQDPYGRE